MTGRRILAALVALSMIGSMSSFAGAADPPPPPPAAPPAPTAAQPTASASDVTPARVSYLHGEVSFWRPGAEDWAPAKLNTPLAPGDVLFAGPGGNVEVQIGPRAFVRASDGTQLGLDNQEPDFLQLRVTAGHAAVDLRDLPAGATVELATPNAAFTIERKGYYHVAVTPDSATFRTHRGGSAVMTPAGGAATTIGSNQQVVVTGTEAPRVEAGAAPELTAWDRWGYQRSDALVSTASVQHVGTNVYGTEALDRYGSWRTVDTYGTVWVPAGVSAGWSPYSTGRWIWDPRYGWTWLDDAPWGWAPYHYGRWVHAGSYWAWAPGPVLVRPVYAPALVVFLGGGVSVSIGRPVYWAPLAWGEPVIPWWGRPGFVGHPWWGGWGGPRVVNNVVVHQTTTVNVTNINVYRNVNVTNAVVGVPAERFGRGQDRPTRLAQTDVQHLSPVRGALDVRPTAASVMPASGQTVKPPAAVRERPVVATRAPHDVRPALQAEGLGGTAAASAPAPRIVPSPRPGSHQERATATPAPAPQVAPAPGAPAPGAPAPAGQEQRKARSIERATPPTPPGSATPGSARTAPPELRERARPEVPAQPESPRKITKPDEPGVRPMPVPQPPQPPATSRQAPTTQPAPAPQPPATIRQAPPAPPQQAPPAPPPQPPATTRQAPASPGPVVAPRPAPQAPPAQEERGPRGGRDEQQRPDPRGKNPGPSSRVEPPARPEQTQRTERVPRLEPPARAERGEQPQRAERAPHLEPPARAERPESPQPRTERGDRPGRAGRESRLEPSHAKGPVASTQEGGHRDRN